MISSSGNKGFYFKEFEAKSIPPFEMLFDIFKELITHTSGDFDEAIAWLRELDKEYQLTDENYTIDDFIEDLKDKGYIREEIDSDGGTGMGITAKTERAIRQTALENIFGNLHKSGAGNHKTKSSGLGEDPNGEFRPYHFGDGLDKISLTESLKNAQINHGMGQFELTEDDLVVEDSRYNAQMSTVLMIDISHSMILYGGRPHHAGEKSCDGPGRTHHHPISKRHHRYSRFWKRCMDHFHKRHSLPEGRSLPYQYRCRTPTGHGYFAT